MCFCCQRVCCEKKCVCMCVVTKKERSERGTENEGEKEVKGREEVRGEVCVCLCVL